MNKKSPYRFSLAGVIFISAIGLIVGLICGFGIARHIYKKAEAIEQKVQAKRAYDGKPIEINGDRFLCTVLMAGAGDTHKEKGK